MLQRIQTIFLGMIALSTCIFLFLPIWDKIDPITLHSYTLYAWKLKELTPIDNLSNTQLLPYAFLGSLAIIISLVATYAALRFDNRMLQLKLGTVNSLLLTALLGMVYLLTKNQTALLPEVAVRYRIGFMMPGIAVVSNLLANYFIRKDEKLVQSANRIR